ncbi:unnamed protein product [Cuscuta epithymum]|uniref:GH16 domain-containing protein n=1 Tax=Cuscuta epithymum TaxID=186058 RepID=A0AAV0FHM5_9ASTE|nr:unnamed protein product [Cuscuta epithymum]
MEFLGTAGKNYKLQTNVYLKGSGDGFFDHKTPVVGREMTFDLWFDPAQQYHRYAILWTPTQIIFFVDDIPIRHYPKKSSATYPENAMREYIS